jgi:ABC-type amino acid transport substrate-binding protein
MTTKTLRAKHSLFHRLCLFSLLLLPLGLLKAGDLAEVKASGVLRHIGVPYANFITGSGDGMDVEIMQQFATSLGVRYEYIPADWGNLFCDLVGRKIESKGNNIEDLGPVPVRADIAANGITVLPWRSKVVDFSDPTFPTQVWLVTRVDCPIKPIKPSGSLEADIMAVKKLMAGHSLFTKTKTCLDPALFDLEQYSVSGTEFKGSLNELAPAVINGESEMTLLDVPDTLVALKKWPGKLKVIGPVGAMQDMCVAFPKTSPELRAAFNVFLKQLKADGTYDRLVEKYYPYALQFFPQYFGKGAKTEATGAKH